MATIDVVIPCYNYARFLRRCVESVTTQTGVDVRVLIIDDASSDDSAIVAEDLVAKDSRIEFIRHAKNQGHIRTYNEGLVGWASNQYSLLLSADDLLTPGSLSRATTVLDGHPAITMVYGMALSFVGEDTPPPVPTYADEREVRVTTSADFIEHCFRFGNDVPTPTAVVRTKVQQEVGGYDQNLKHSGDMEMWLRFAARGQIGVLRSVQAYYRHHATNMSRQYLEAAFVDAREQLTAYITFHNSNRIHIDRIDGLSESLRRQISEKALWLANRALDLGFEADAENALTTATQHYPAINQTRLWRRVHIKKRFGAKTWPKVRAVLARCGLLQRDIASIPASAHSKANHWRSGWWPEDKASCRLAPVTD